jgi:hypothetical protein
MKNVNVVVLSCLHTVVYKAPAPSPRHGDTVLCQRCNDYRQVGVAPKNYVVNCVSCKRWAHREYGNAFVTAETRAVTHAAKNAGHRVRLIDDDRIVGEWFHAPLPVELADAPPF